MKGSETTESQKAIQIGHCSNLLTKRGLACILKCLPTVVIFEKTTEAMEIANVS